MKNVIRIYEKIMIVELISLLVFLTFLIAWWYYIDIILENDFSICLLRITNYLKEVPFYLELIGILTIVGSFFIHIERRKKIILDSSIIILTFIISLIGDRILLTP